MSAAELALGMHLEVHTGADSRGREVWVWYLKSIEGAHSLVREDPRMGYS